MKVQQNLKTKCFLLLENTALDSKENWIVGVMAKYNLFSGIDNKKYPKCSRAQKKGYAAELMTERTKQETRKCFIQNLIVN